MKMMKTIAIASSALFLASTAPAETEALRMEKKGVQSQRMDKIEEALNTFMVWPLLDHDVQLIRMENHVEWAMYDLSPYAELNAEELKFLKKAIEVTRQSLKEQENVLDNTIKKAIKEIQANHTETNDVIARKVMEKYLEGQQNFLGLLEKIVEQIKLPEDERNAWRWTQLISPIDEYVAKIKDDVARKTAESIWKRVDRQLYDALPKTKNMPVGVVKVDLLSGLTRPEIRASKEENDVIAEKLIEEYRKGNVDDAYLDLIEKLVEQIKLPENERDFSTIKDYVAKIKDYMARKTAESLVTRVEKQLDAAQN